MEKFADQCGWLLRGITTGIESSHCMLGLCDPVAC